MAYAQFAYTSYPTTPSHQMVSVSSGGPLCGSSVSSSCGSPQGLTSSPPPPQSPPCADSSIISPPAGLVATGSNLVRASSPSPSPPVSAGSSATGTSAVVQQAAAYESRLLSATYHHHPSIHPAHHSHQVHPRLTAAGFYGATSGSSLHTSASYSTADTGVAANGYASLTSVDSSAFYPTLGSGFGMKDDPWRGSLSTSSHASNPHQTTAPYYYDPTLAAYGYGGLDFNGARRKNVTRDSTTTLKAWLGEHRKNPYPTKGEKIMLAIITKMTLTQVSTWFANARRRLKKENKMTWEPRNKVEADDHQADDSQNDSGRRSEDEDRKPNKETPLNPLNTKRERLEKDDNKSSCVDVPAVNVGHHDIGVVVKRNDDFEDRNRSLASCLSRTHSLDSNDPGLCRNRAPALMTNDTQNGSRLASLALHGAYPGPVINEFPGSCLQIPFSSVPNASSSFRHHHSPILGSDPLISPTVPTYSNRYQVSPEHPNALSLSTASAFTPTTTSSSEGDSQDLLSCNALDAFIKDASMSSSSSSEANSTQNSPLGAVGDVSDSPFPPVIPKPKIWSLAATATSKSPPPNVQMAPASAALQGQSHLGSCAKFSNSDMIQNQSYQKHCQLNNHHRDSFCPNSGLSYQSDNWYAYPNAGRHQQQSHPQFQQTPGHSGFNSRSCFSPSPPQTDTPPQTPPSLKLVGHQLNSYSTHGEHIVYGNYNQHQMHGVKSPVDGSKSVEASMLACTGQLHDARDNSLDKRVGVVVGMESTLAHGANLEGGGPSADYHHHHQLSLSEDESSSPCAAASVNGHRENSVHGVQSVLTSYRNCFSAGEAEFEIP